MKNQLVTLLFVLVIVCVFYVPAFAQEACSPGPCVLTPVQASEGGTVVNDAAMATDPVNPNHILLGSNDFNCYGGVVNSILGFYSSTDAGASWSRSDCMPDVGVYSPGGGQPILGYDLDGTAYVGGVYENNDGLSEGIIGVQKSSDGVTWSQPVAAIGSYNERHGLALDPWMTIDDSPSSPFAKSIYVSAYGFIGNYANVHVVVSHSSDGGNTWKLVPVGPWVNSPGFEYNTHVATGRNGTVYVSWQYCPEHGSDAGCAKSITFFLLSKSPDGGDTWAKPSYINSYVQAPGGCCQVGPILPNSMVSVSNYPTIAVDNSSGPYSGNLYLVYYNWTGTYMQVLVKRSTDGGTNWSKPVPVAPLTDTHDQFFPWISVSADGIVGVSWLDRRNDPQNINYQAFAAFSTDGGKTFGTNYQLTTAFSNPNNNGYGNGDWLGDYTGNTWAGSTFHVGWMDTSNGIDTQVFTGGVKLK